LTEEEKALFGNNCPCDYKKQKILGKGGFAIVWQGENLKTK